MESKERTGITVMTAALVVLAGTAETDRTGATVIQAFGATKVLMEIQEPVDWQAPTEGVEQMPPRSMV
jgi:hypothetical protein